MNRTKEEKRAYYRQYYKNNKEKRLATIRKWTKKNKKRIKKVSTKWRIANREKINAKAREWRNRLIDKSAHRKVYLALKKGILKKQPCVYCKKKRVDAHHDDYSKPLKVIWVCRKCHSKLHRK